ncbi:uncharacterized protein LOC124458415 [Xenia sp. Carnegie-2017]|uniref:uncharacterized protein LOC124458415 n=1 Tax=Xenia sp. Carnegie-2017 TaxID=2897299 RepID=UPI001F046B15|nr:uncharacterized protein LOC124458415 [Xenia sp. Carnegie-2017]
MVYNRSLIAKLAKFRTLKLALMIQSIVTTLSIIYIMIQTDSLDRVGRLEIVTNRCQGCCKIENYSILAISRETQIADKLHKLSRALRQYEIPDNIMNILHEAERTIENLESELEKYRTFRLSRLKELEGNFIEEDISQDEELVPKTKPTWKKKVIKVLKCS